MHTVYSLYRGIKVNEYKVARNLPIERFKGSDRVVIRLPKAEAAGYRATVSVGQKVYVGSALAEPCADGFCKVFSGVSGEILDIEKCSADTESIAVITVSNDGELTPDPCLSGETRPLSELTSEEISDRIKDAGITEPGREYVPAYLKIQKLVGKTERLFINCLECAPFESAKCRLLTENPAEIIGGAMLLMRALKIGCCEPVLPAENSDAVNAILEKCAQKSFLTPRIVESKYPCDMPRFLVKAVAGIDVPNGSEPEDIGYAVFDASTCCGIFRAFAEGMPKTDVCITVGGDCVVSPKNISVPIGSSFSSVVDFCGGLEKEPYRATDGNPMNGDVIDYRSEFVSFNTESLTLLSRDFCGNTEPTACIRCARCVSVCPMKLEPHLIYRYIENSDAAVRYGLASCVGCGACSYICPSKIDLSGRFADLKKKLN